MKSKPLGLGTSSSSGKNFQGALAEALAEIAKESDDDSLMDDEDPIHTTGWTSSHSANPNITSEAGMGKPVSDCILGRDSPSN